MAFQTSFVARFGDVDPAGIIYFARFLDFFHQALEAYFDERLGWPYAAMVTRQRLGVPVVRIEGDFAVPVAFGERFFVSVKPKRLGRSSMTFEYELTKEGEPRRCAAFAITHVLTDLSAMRPAEIPQALRSALERDL
jgi:4-hydroxybenzoyl-CoA thioesterase